MGFSGGGSNVLLPHTHDGTVAQDGGPLDFDNVTQADLTAGDVVFSDGAHLQRLAIGTPAQQIQVNAGATAPEYFTPAAGSAIYEKVGSQVVASNQQTMTITPTTPIAFDTVAYFVVVFNGELTGVSDCHLTINGLASNYFYTGQYVNNASRTLTVMGNAPGGDPDFDIDASANFGPHLFCVARISADPVNDLIMSQITTSSQECYGSWGGYNSTAAQTTLSTVSLRDDGGNFLNGSTLDLYKVNI